MPVQYMGGSKPYSAWSDVGGGLSDLTNVLMQYYGNNDGGGGEVPIPKKLTPEDINNALPPEPEMDPNVIGALIPKAETAAQGGSVFSPWAGQPGGMPPPMPLGGNRRPPLSMDDIMALFGVTGSAGAIR